VITPTPEGWRTKNGCLAEVQGLAPFLLRQRNMKAAALFFAVVGLVALSSPCFAAEGDSFGPRVGVALGGVIGLARNRPGGDNPLTFGRGSQPGTSGAEVDAGALNPTLHLDLGVRINPYVSAYARGEAGTIILASQAAAYGIVEWTPMPRLSLGTGIGADFMVVSGGSGWSAVSIPLIVGVDVNSWNRSVLRIGLEVAAGLQPSTSTYGWHAALTFGWVLN
jgi:hypothetical protein